MAVEFNHIPNPTAARNRDDSGGPATTRFLFTPGWDRDREQLEAGRFARSLSSGIGSLP